MFNLKMIQTLIPILLLLAAGQLEVEGRKFVVANSCKGDVWAAYTAPQKYDVTVNGKSGMGMWHQKSGQEDILEVPETFAAGKFWAATGCDENGTGCKVGGCPSGKCDGIQVGQSGATLAEVDLTGGETFDISITDGFNVPIAFTPTGGTGAGCKKATCGTQIDLLTQCDAALAFPAGSDTVWACLNPCTAGIQYKAGAQLPFSAATAPSCCPDGTPGSCDIGKEVSMDKAVIDVPFVAALKESCKDGFVYPNELSMNHMCSGPEYRIEFCPGGVGIGANPSGNAPVPQCAGEGAIVGGGFTGTNSDGGGSFEGLATDAGQTCDGSGSAASSSGDTDAATSGTESTEAADTASASSDTSSSGSGTDAGSESGEVAGAGSSVAASSQAPVASASVGAGTDTGSTAGSGTTSTDDTTEQEAEVVAPVATTAVPKASTSAAAAAPATSATASTCKGGSCRAGGSRGPRLAKRRVVERDWGCDS